MLIKNAAPQTTHFGEFDLVGLDWGPEICISVIFFFFWMKVVQGLHFE